MSQAEAPPPASRPAPAPALPSLRSVALVPYYGAGAHLHYESLRLQLPPGTPVAQHGRNTVDAARSILLDLGLSQTSAEVAVFIDSDVSFTRADYDLIVDGAIETEGIVGAPYLTKFLDGRQKSTATPALGELSRIDFYGAGQRYPALHLGMGFTAIHRSVLDRVASYHQMERCLFGEAQARGGAYPLFLPMVRDGQYQHEDYAFCIRAREAGVPIFVDTRPTGLRHHGEHGYRLEDIGYVSRHAPEMSWGFQAPPESLKRPEGL